MLNLHTAIKGALVTLSAVSIASAAGAADAFRRSPSI